MSARDGIERVRRALEDNGVALTSHPDGSLRGRCPVHQGTTRTSLSLRHHMPHGNDRGRAQVRCWAACDERDVLEQIGLTLADLYDDPPPRTPGVVTREHVYLDASASLLGLVRRTEPKSFRPATPGPNGWAAKSSDELQRTPYRLPAVVAAVAAGQPVYVVEGERDADALAAVDVVATCNAGGAGKWTADHAHWLRGATVVVCRDRDDAGRRHAEQVIATLTGTAAAVTLVEPAEGKDVADHLAAGRAVDELVPVELTVTSPAEPELPLRRLKVTRASEVVMRRIRWLWTLRIVLGGLTLLAGREGIGKSTVAAWLCAAVTRGELDGELDGQPRAVVYVNSEDARDYTIVPRLRAAGADLDRVIFVDAVMPGDDGRDYESSLVLPADAHLLADIVAEHQAALVILDAATSTIDSRLDGDRDRQMRQGLEAIGRDIGERAGCAVLGIVHFGKRDSSDTGKLILGSIAWSQVARSVLAVALDEENGSLVVSRTKGNLGLEPPSLAAQIVSERVLTEEGDTFVGRMEWLGETDRDARTLLAAVELDQEDRTERDSAAEWLEDFLTPTPVDAREKVPSKDVKKAARDAGFSERTLARARASLAVRVISEGFPRESFWSLPSDASPASDATPSVGARRGGTTGLDGTTGPDLQLCNADGSCSPQSCQSCHPHMHGTTDGATADEDPTTEQWRISGRPA